MAKRNFRIERLVKKAFNRVYSETKEVLDVKLSKQEKRKFIKKYRSTKEYNAFCKKLSKQLSDLGLKEQKKEWRSHYDKLKRRGVSLPPYGEVESNISKEVSKDSFRFVKSIPTDILKLNKLKYLETLQQQILEGTAPRRSLEVMMKEMGVKYSKVISRTETSRLQTSVVQERSNELGAKAYLWLASKDKRTRESHRNMNNVVVLWEGNDEKKPYLDKMNGNAGEFPNCRCSPEPIFDESDLPSGGMLNVYNYSKKKIVKINRKEMKELLL